MRRILTSIDGGVQIDALEPTVGYKDGHTLTEIWVTNNLVPNLNEEYVKADDFSLFLKAGHSRFITCEIPPLKQIKVHELEVNKSFDDKEYGKHNTLTIDYVTVLEGNIDLLVSDTRVSLNPGDVVVQRGAIHAWHNLSDKTCKILAVMIGADENEKFIKHDFIQQELE